MTWQRATTYGRKSPHGRLPGGRRSHCQTEDMDYTDDELEFFRAVEKFKADFHDPFPTLRDLLGIVKTLGYQKA